MSAIRRGTQLAFALALTTVGIAATTPEAQAYVPDVPPCYGATCVGKSPYIQNRDGESCVSGIPDNGDGAVDLAGSAVAGVGDGSANSIVLRWSPFCHANWVRFTGDPNSLRYASFFAETQDGHQEWAQGAYTYMVDGNQPARGCVKPLTLLAYTCPVNPDGTARWF